MSNWIGYTADRLGWALGGVGVTLTYQIITNWYRGKHGGNKLPPISANAYFGTMLLLFAIIPSLFSLNQKLAADRNLECQRVINRNNVSVANDRQQNIIDFTVRVRNELRSEKVSKNEIIKALDNLISESTAAGVTIPTADCKNGNTPENFTPKPSESP